MQRAHYTFQDIIDLNQQDWDKAYTILQTHLANNNLQKKMLRGDLIIYIPAPDLLDMDLVHDNFFHDPKDPYQAYFGG